MKIVIIDDHPIVRKGLEQVLSLEEDFEVVGTAASCREGKELLMAQKPNVAIVDLRMPDGNGCDLIKSIKNQVPDCRFIILTSYAGENDISRALSEKIDGYILKEALPEELISAIKIVVQGRRYFDPGVMNTLINNEEDDPLRNLTEREQEVLWALAEGLNNRAIGQKLFISENTVKKHVGNLLSKLDFHDRTQAALYAFSRGLNKGAENTQAI